MDRKQLANKMFQYLKQNTPKKEKDIWKAIAETDDYSLLNEYTEKSTAIEAVEQIPGQTSLFD